MTHSANKSPRTASKLGAETGIDDDMLSGVVGGAGAPGALPSKVTGSADDHLHTLNNALPFDPQLLHGAVIGHTPVSVHHIDPIAVHHGGVIGHTPVAAHHIDPGAVHHGGVIAPMPVAVHHGGVVLPQHGAEAPTTIAVHSTQHDHAVGVHGSQTTDLGRGVTVTVDGGAHAGAGGQAHFGHHGGSAGGSVGVGANLSESYSGHAGHATTVTGTIGVTAGAGAEGSVSGGKSGAHVEGGVGAGITDTVSIQQHTNLGHGAYIENKVSVEAGFKAEAKGDIHLEKGHVGAGGQVIAGDVVEVKVTHTVGNHDASGSGTMGVAAPGSVGVGGHADATMKHGNLTIGAGGMGDIGIGGLELGGSLTVNTKPIVHLGEEVGHHVAPVAHHLAHQVEHGATGAVNHLTHGGSHLGHHVEHGATGAVNHLSQGAHTVSHGATEAGHKVENVAKEVGHKAENVVKDAGHKAESGLHKVGKALGF